MAEGARLESVWVGNCLGGSNPPLSALKLIVIARSYMVLFL